jgi:RNA polymerase sigma factor (TIGR02999 family)
MASPDDVTRLLQRWREGDPDAGARVVAATYQELRRIARGAMRGERAQHTLQATALVHEAYLRLFRDAPVALASREEFLRLMATEMRRHLIDHARRRRADKRGGGAVHEPVDEIDLPAAAAEESPEVFLARLDAALDKLMVEHPRVADVIRLRFMGDLSIEEAARALKLSAGTVKRDYALGRAWLARELTREL